jgi:hypothetical protein
VYFKATRRTVNIVTEPLQVGQFGIVDHEPVDRGPNAGVFQGKGPAGDRAELFVVAEGTTPAGEAFAGHVVSNIGQTWANLDMSLTGALRRIFVEAEHNVLDWNAKSVAQHRVSLGLSCFARKGDHAVVAQAGPTVAFHLHRGNVTVFAPEDDHGTPIGSGAFAEPQLTRIEFEAGDRLLMFSTTALTSVDEELVGGILALPGIQVLQDLYRRVQHLRHLTVLLVEAPAEPDEDVQDDGRMIGGGEPVIGGEQDHHHRQGFQPSLFVDAEDTEEHSEAEAARQRLTSISERVRMKTATLQDRREEVAPLQRVAGDTGLGSIAALQRERASASMFAAVSAPAVTPSSGRPTWRNSDEAGSRSASTGSNGGNGPSGSFSRSLVRQRSHPKPDPSVSNAPLASEMAARQRRLSATSANGPAFEAEAASGFGGGILVRPRSSMGGRWKGSGSLSRRSVAAAQAPSTRFVVVVGLALLLGLVAVLTIPQMVNTDNDGRVAQLLDSAEKQLAAARVQNDPSLQRTALTEAKALLLEAEQVGGTTTETQSLINEVAGAISTLDAIVEPARVELIGSLESYGDSPVTPADISIGPGLAYLMDTTASQVIAQPLDGGAASTIYREGGEEGYGRPIALTYYRSPLDPDGGRLLIADTQGALWTYTPAEGVSRVEINLPPGARLTDIATHNGELYVLDAQAGTIYRMTGIDGSFPYEPQVARQGDDLKSAVRMMVDDEIITSSTSGSLQRYSGELMLQLSQAGIDRRLTQPAAPWAIGDGFVAMADPANNRVVVLRRDGTFVRQYRHQSFGDLVALGMRDNAGYVFAGGKLLRVTWDD